MHEQLTGAGMVLTKRREQVDAGYNADHDLACHEPGDLATAGACLAQAAAFIMEGGDPDVEYGDVHPFWPFDSDAWRKLVSLPLEEVLAVGGAFLAAEIDVMRLRSGG